MWVEFGDEGNERSQVQEKRSLKEATLVLKSEHIFYSYSR